MKTIIIRTLGGKGIGYGHFYRCLSLVKAIRLLDEEIAVTFLINQELIYLLDNTKFEFILSDNLNEDFGIIDKLNIDLFILDSYLGNNEYLKKIKEKSKLMLIDDNNDIYDSSIPDIIYNGNIHAKSLGYPDANGQLKLLGSDYLIMKEEYWDIDKHESVNKEGILITTGGTDEYEITIKIMNAIKDIGVKINIVIGPGYEDKYIKKIEDIQTKNMSLIYKPSSLKEYISSSKIVITAGGSTIYEVLTQKSIPIVFSIADNQDLICKELMDMGVGYLGKYPNIDYYGLMEMVGGFRDYRINFNDKVFNIVKGDGAIVVAKNLLYYMELSKLNL